MAGTYGIFAPNASGKSSSMDALIFALFDKTPRAFKGSDIMNNRKSKFDVQLVFEVDNKQYVIRRQGLRKKNGAVKVDVNFLLVNPDGSFTSLNGAERSDTNNNIRSLIGTYEDFVLTALSSQNANSLFIDKSHSERKDLLNQFMGLTIFDKLERVANDLSKEVQGALRKFKNDDFTQMLANIQTELDTLLKKEIIVNIKRTSVANELSQVEKLINELYGEKLPVEGGDIDVAELNKKKSLLHDKILKVQPEIEQLQDQIDELENQITNSPLIIRDEQEVLAVAESISLINKAISKLDQKITKERTLYNSIKERVSWLNTHEYDPNCEYCVNNVFFKAALKDKEEMDTHFKQIQALTEMKNSELVNQSSEEETLRKYKEELSSKAKIEQLKTQKLNHTVKLQESKMAVIEMEKKILEIETQIKVYHAQEQAIQHNNEIDEVLAVHKEKKERIQDSLTELDKSLREIHANTEVCKSKKDELLQKLKEAEELELEFEGYRYYMDAVGRDGVPYDLITKIIPNIEAEINNLLSQIVDFTVTLTVDDKNINGKIVYDYERLWPLENSSGMERFISSLAIRVALMKASNLPKPNFLILDEGMGVLDADNMTSMNNLFNILKSQFDFVIIISHLDVVRDMVDNLIEIKKEDGYSYIQYV
jgi:DNA repair exonuclease SbcCD ATPase subunit